MQVASEEMHLTLLPAARTIYAQENAALTAASARATGLPWIVVVLALAVALGFVLFRAQRWLTRRTHRVVNYGLLVASLVLVVSVLWLAVAFAVARGGPAARRRARLASRPRPSPRRPSTPSRPAVTRCSTSSRAAATPRSSQDFQAVRARLGPGPGTLLTAAAHPASGAGARLGRGGGAATSRAWYAVIDQAYRLDSEANYTTETPLVIGPRAGTSSRGIRPGGARSVPGHRRRPGGLPQPARRPAGTPSPASTRASSSPRC